MLDAVSAARDCHSRAAARAARGAAVVAVGLLSRSPPPRRGAATRPGPLGLPVALLSSGLRARLVPPPGPTACSRRWSGVRVVVHGSLLLASPSPGRSTRASPASRPRARSTTTPPRPSTPTMLLARVAVALSRRSARARRRRRRRAHQRLARRAIRPPRRGGMLRRSPCPCAAPSAACCPGCGRRRRGADHPTLAAPDRSVGRASTLPSDTVRRTSCVVRPTALRVLVSRRSDRRRRPARRAARLGAQRRRQHVPGRHAPSPLPTQVVLNFEEAPIAGGQRHRRQARRKPVVTSGRPPS